MIADGYHLQEDTNRGKENMGGQPKVLVIES